MKASKKGVNPNPRIQGNLFCGDPGSPGAGDDLAAAGWPGPQGGVSESNKSTST